MRDGLRGEDIIRQEGLGKAIKLGEEVREQDGIIKLHTAMTMNRWASP